MGHTQSQLITADIGDLRDANAVGCAKIFHKNALAIMGRFIATACVGGGDPAKDTTAPDDAFTTAAPVIDPPETELMQVIPYLGNHNTGCNTIISQDQPLITRDADGMIVLAMGTKHMIAIGGSFNRLIH